MKRRLLSLVIGLAACGATVPATASPLAASITHHPRVPVNGHVRAGWASSNWSGYAIAGSGFGAITGSWIVPAVSRTKKATYSSNWIGIDGFNNASLIQTGTESDYVNGSARYRAWWEILPAPETIISSITVRPGDHMSASVTKGSGSSWTITISDNTGGQSFTTVQSYSGPQTSAEWIEEAPTVGGRTAKLAHYGLATFDPGTVNGGNPGLTASESGVMIQRGVQVSTPSVPDSDTDGFNMAYGSRTPSPPNS